MKPCQIHQTREIRVLVAKKGLLKRQIRRQHPARIGVHTQPQGGNQRQHYNQKQQPERPNRPRRNRGDPGADRPSNLLARLIHLWLLHNVLHFDPTAIKLLLSRLRHCTHRVSLGTTLFCCIRVD